MSQTRNFMLLLKSMWVLNRFVCVGLDANLDAIPDWFKKPYKNIGTQLFEYCKAIVDVTHNIVGAYKINTAFFEAYGEEGWRALKTLVFYIQSIAPEIPIILDGKRTDIGNTNNAYCKMLLDVNADALTINPYFGKIGVQPFLDMKNKGIIVLCRTSNEGAEEFQNEKVLQPDGSELFLFQRVGINVATTWNKNGNCMLVVGATAPTELKTIRKLVGNEIPILIPGIGKQGGDLVLTLTAGMTPEGGVLINSSRGIIFASKEQDFAEAALAATQKLHDDITTFRGFQVIT